MKFKINFKTRLKIDQLIHHFPRPKNGGIQLQFPTIETRYKPSQRYIHTHVYIHRNIARVKQACLNVATRLMSQPAPPAKLREIVRRLPPYDTAPENRYANLRVNPSNLGPAQPLHNRFTRSPSSPRSTFSPREGGEGRLSFRRYFHPPRKVVKRGQLGGLKDPCSFGRGFVEVKKGCEGLSLSPLLSSRIRCFFSYFFRFEEGLLIFVEDAFSFEKRFHTVWNFF